MIGFAEYNAIGIVSTIDLSNPQFFPLSGARDVEAAESLLTVAIEHQVFEIDEGFEIG